jgi:hypothetical protein
MHVIFKPALSLPSDHRILVNISLDSVFFHGGADLAGDFSLFGREGVLDQSRNGSLEVSV